MESYIRRNFGRRIRKYILFHSYVASTALMKWDEYRIVFGSDEDVIETLNRAAPHFFGIVQAVILDDIVLHVMRLFDRKGSAGKRRLSVRAMPDFVVAPFKVELERQIDQAESKCGSLRSLRHSRLAHRQLDLSNGGAALAPPVTRAEVSQALFECGEILYAVSEHYGIGRFEYVQFVGLLTGGHALISTLRAGLAAREEKQALVAAALAANSGDE